MVNKLEPKDRDIDGFQSCGLHPNMTVYENIRFPCASGRASADQHKERCCGPRAWSNSPDLLDRRPPELGAASANGWLGRAIVREPTVFLMDEPLSNLDANCAFRPAQDQKPPNTLSKRQPLHVTHDSD